MNDISIIAGNCLALVIILLFFLLLYAGITKKSLIKIWDEINDWIGAK